MLKVETKSKRTFPLIKVTGTRKSVMDMMSSHNPVMTDHMEQDIDREARRDLFRSKRYTPARRFMVLWGIVATALLVMTMFYNVYLLNVIGELVMDKYVQTGQITVQKSV